MRPARIARVASSQPGVILRKIGASHSGFTTGNTAPRMRRTIRTSCVKSDLIINGPTAYLDNLPDDLKAAIRTTWLDAAKNDKVDYDRLSDGKNRPWEPIADADYDKTIELVKFVDQLRKKKS